MRVEPGGVNKSTLLQLSPKLADFVMPYLEVRYIVFAHLSMSKSYISFEPPKSVILLRKSVHFFPLSALFHKPLDSVAAKIVLEFDGNRIQRLVEKSR